MTLLLCLIVAAYAVKATAVDVAAAVKGHPLPSQQQREQRQKDREHRRENPGYFGRIWNNSLESWADASTRRHQRRMALRQAREEAKGPEWVAKKLEAGRKAAARREKFATRFGVLWGKARDLPKNARERRREDEAWAANARIDAEQDDTVPAGLQGSTDLDQDEAMVLPFRPRDEDDTEDEKSGERTKPWVCRWGAWEGDSPCVHPRDMGSEYCMDHTSQHKTRCTWGAEQRCRKPRLSGSAYCPEHHTADPKIQAAVESTRGFEHHQRDDVRPLHETSAAADLLTCLWGAEEGKRCTSLKLDDSAYCGDHKLADDSRCKAGDVGGEPRCGKPVHGRSPFCYEHHTEDPEIQAGIEARWGKPTSPPSDTDQPVVDGQDSTITETEKENTMSTPTTNAPAEITSLTDAISYTQSMQTSLADVDDQVDQWSADLKAFAEKARAANTEVETAIASLRDLEVEGNKLVALEAAREQLEVIASVFGGAAEQVGAASDSAQAGAAAFGEAHAGFTAQTGIQEQIQAAQASGNRAGKREFYEAG